MLKCPVCGKTFFEESGDHDICPVCRWENDGLQYKDHNYAGGANRLSVNECRIEYFLQNNARTAGRANVLAEGYASALREIIDAYSGTDRTASPDAAENERADYASARKNYVDKLNRLMLTLLDKEGGDEF
ncbi:CPCC family cysteine-rich protein [uncultured Ruminococcus sp.]|uniref:CPCC family cysteine-rich protein n=1 Tax=uncultured Ruminococcus sp. TaxID=165186 RepID=UPI0025E3A92B|nr:CPCC family cysteine-rich protein [uncultured Ruminococcus sp.]